MPSGSVGLPLTSGIGSVLELLAPSGVPGGFILGRAFLGLIEKVGTSTDGLPIEFVVESVPPGISGDAVIEPPVLPSIPGMLFVKPVGATLDNPSVPNLKLEGNARGCGKL